ncbi:RagB/SusD family nutrient uptake outer membrane protein [Flexithrix dorotheae]|uniref:RagB/SusD family nutrient uptake outer membrane protein n=1 Tax=Flexithrix dorotheae TaxID=70993 RepID=UPI00036AD1C2|nr:RagB/SusD family nutrient uptake outer membrane protein [Flexithrix dorotheae]
MKKIYIKLKYVFFSLLFLFSISCDEQEFLKEEPLDFFSPGNAYVTFSDYQSALTDLYSKIRSLHYEGNNQDPFAHFLATDIAKHARGDANRFGDYDVWLIPTNGMVNYHWTRWYKIIANANTIISNIEMADLSDEEKAVIDAEAKLFRAFSYRYLVYIFGGVPIILDEVTAPKADFTRASKEEVLNQIIADVTVAANNLPSISEVADGKVSNLVAYHLLAETQLALGNVDAAIAAATKVIDDPNTALMTERFGTRANETPGDVYWDLFRANNQNRSIGNMEALWVIQMETDVPGGLLESSGGNGNNLERWAGPVAWLTYKDPDGEEGSLQKPQSNYNSGGRGVSFMSNTDYFLNDLWVSDWDNDIRNAPHNIVRDFIYNNPESAWYDSSSVKYPSPTWENQNWRWYPYPTKITTPGNHPDPVYEDKENQILKSSAGSTYSDQYLLRLAETYLLRAEAYLAKGDAANAAADVNMVRARSNANPVSAANVTLDYILDERARELVYEEHRRITLSRTGKLVERVRKYNKLNGDEIKDFHALWPIPFSEIEANKDAVLEQNPGYN